MENGLCSEYDDVVKLDFGTHIKVRKELLTPTYLWSFVEINIET